MLDLRDRTVAITGASGGIGAAVARACARRGAKVVLGARRVDELEKVAAELRSKGGVAHAIPCDVTKLEDNERFVREAVEKTGGVDVFVANAGVMMVSSFEKTTLETFQRVMDVNYYGVLYGLKAALPEVRKRKGQLAVVSSINGKRGLPSRSGYSASKFALHGLCDSLRVELLGTGTGVTLFCPGVVNTEIRDRAVQFDAPESAKKLRGMSADRAAEIFVRAIERRRREVVTPFYLRLALLGWAVAPGLLDWIVARRLPTETR
jgi:short-subunit dehydrogenase